jgi:hypothetical protein
MRAPRIFLIGKDTPSILRGESKISLETTPKFYTWTFKIHEDPGKRAWVQAGLAAEAPAQTTDVYLDGLILVVGDFSTTGTPEYYASSVVWDGHNVENLLRTPSAESGWINPQAWTDELWTKVFGYSGQRWASLVFYTLRDWPGAGWYYKVTGASLFRTFWATFGWGHVDLSGGKPYRVLLVITAFLAWGGGIGLWQKRHKLRWEVLFFFFLAAGAIWGLTLVRGAHHVLSSFISIPVARYAFPVLFPIALLFAFGANTWQITIAKVIHPLQKFPGILWGGFLAVLSIWAWVSIYNFYY